MFVSKRVFIQVFIRDPFLIEGHAFEIGIYVLITSLDPLVIYRFTSECLIRLCPDSYYPFDPLNTRKYVVGDENLNFWEIPPFKDFDGKFSHLKMFENYFESKNQSVKNFWEQIDDAIVTVTLEKLQLMANELELQCSVYNCSNENFFELLRFDFIIARDGNVKLLEVNLNPDFDGIKNEKKKEHYEQVLYNALRLIGAEGFEIFRQDLRTSSMTSRYEDLSIDFNNCKNCQKSCSNPSCNHCISCFSQDFIKTLHNINREHQKRGNFKRIFPSKIYNANVDYLSLMTEKTRRLSNWIGFMCNENIDWC
ncbi:hypothetical protein PVAND_016644 [Polypedilum vanderplanki]|uniref:Uncharacterized protein n=1 Tax=Polypedilum vanderplanki TaxID=319348 RepID=A0A9J6BFQ9_POLVA|nr:hypothetical protein PVAND_016644 [Polypedilum vanderplanki]